MSPNPNRTNAPVESAQPALNLQPAVVPNFLHVPANSAIALEAYLHLYVDGSARAEAALAATDSRRRLS